jgi:hypothetical protein
MANQTEYIFEKDFWGNWKLVPKKQDNGIGWLIVMLIVVVMVCLTIITLPLWVALLGFKMVKTKRYYAGIGSLLALLYFIIDIQNRWITGFLFAGYNDSAGKFTEGLIGEKQIMYVFIANGIGVLLGLYFIVQAYLLNKEKNALNNSTSESETTSDTSLSSTDFSISSSKPKNSSNQLNLVLGLLGVVFAIAVIYFSFNKNKFNNNPISSTIEKKTIVDEGLEPKLKSIDDKDWKLEKSNKIIFSNNSEYLVTMSSKKGDEFELKFKLSIHKIVNNQSQLFWESSYNEGFVFETLEILNTNKSAIIAGVYNLGGAHGLNNYYVVSLSESGIINPVNIVEQYGYIEKSNNSLIIVEANQKIIFKVTNNEIIRSIETKDAMTSEESIKAYFKAENNEIIGTNNPIKIRVGETISFVPLDEYSSKLFNSGEILIYSDAWNNDLSLSEANRIKSGNSYTFESNGTFHFVLCNECNGDQPPTFTINVEN